MPPAFLELTLVLVLCAVLGIVVRFIRQPLILAYIFSGLIISSFGFFSNFDKNFFEALSNIGIAFLLFLVGIELKIEDLKIVGKAAFLTGIGQILFTALVGFILLSALGYEAIPSIYIAVALTFSSTVIIVKLLAEKNDLQSLYGKIAVGFLLVQDFVAIMALMILSGFGVDSHMGILGIAMVLVKGIFLVILAYLSSRYLLKIFFSLAASSTELLFVSAISWAFLFSSVAYFLGFSIAIGAFLAGLGIAASPYSVQISARVKPLKDFFVIIFFLLLGTTMGVGIAELSVVHIVILSAFILIGNPIIVMAIMLTLGYRNRTSFLASVTVAQISEFSLILMAVGLSLGHVTNQMVSLVAAVGIVTITASSYLILYGNKIYIFCEKFISKIFPEKKHDPYVINRDSLKDHVILVGGEQMGWDIIEFLKKKIEEKEQIVVVDFNPQIIKTLLASGYNAVYGDISDPEVLEDLEIGKARLVIITDPDLGDSIHVIKFAKAKNYKGPIIGASYWIHDAIKLYEAGADYVVVPETVGGKHVAKILAESWEDLGKIKKAKGKNFEELLVHKIF